MLSPRFTIWLTLFWLRSLDAQTSQLDSASASAVARLLVRFDATATAAGKLDPEGRAALFSDDATFLNAWGGRIDGRPAIDSALKRLYTASMFDSSRIEILSRQQRLIAPGVVLVDHLECLTGQRGPNSGRELPPRATHITLILRQQPDSEWRIVYYRAGDMREFAQRPPACERLRPGAARGQLRRQSR
jgi:uncharacterized protein (TIGR02246 family)